MHSDVDVLASGLLAADGLLDWLFSTYLFIKVLIGFSIIIFVHELGHFLAAKWMGIRVDRFAIGFFYRICGWRRGEGFTFGRRPELTADELAAKGYGETDYCLNVLPFGGYVKMLGQDDVIVNEETGEMKMSDDPRSFTNKPVGRRMIVVSAGVIFNVVFALLAYIGVFLFTGKIAVAPEIGAVDPGSRAARGGLLPGDWVVAVDGRRIQSWEDIARAEVFAEDPMRFQVRRAGQLLEQPLIVEPPSGNPENDRIGIYPGATAVIGDAVFPSTQPDAPQPGDSILALNGAPLSNPRSQIAAVLGNSHGRPVEFTLERPAKGDGGAARAFTYTQTPVLMLEPARQDTRSESERVDSRHLLGLCQRRNVLQVVQNSPAQAAGFQGGDAIAQWGNVPNPLQSDILDSVGANEGRPIPVVVERDGQSVELSVTPRADFGLFSSKKPMVGIAFGGEDTRIIVADVARETAAAQVGMPRGSEILAVNGQAVRTWSDLCEAFQKAAGTTVTMHYRTGRDEADGQMAVPSSIVNELGLSPTVQILSIDGERSVRLESGTMAALPAFVAVQVLLQKNIGRTVVVQYAADVLDPEPITQSFAITADNADPWQLRIHYAFDSVAFQPKTTLITAGGNPWTACTLAGRETVNVFETMWKMFKALFTPRSRVNASHVAGPIGIFQIAINQAETGTADLIFFLAFISLNLAAINFVPFPVVDGGLMVFLLLERLRGKPLSIKVQVTTTLIGLAVIVSIFLFVTFQDISRWWGS